MRNEEAAAQTYRFPIRAAEVRAFALATLSTNPAYAADGIPLGTPVPPTFMMAAQRYRPPVAADPNVLPGGVRSLWGEQAFEYREPVLVGDELEARPGRVERLERTGRRGGAMTLVVTETIFAKGGRAAVIARGTRITTSVDVSTMPRASAGSVPPPAMRSAPLAGGPIRAGEAVMREVVIERAHITAYGHAASDLAPIHLDDDFARRYGNPSVFAHGMLSGGIIATLAADWLGPRALRSIAMRFSARVFPGDAIRYVVHVREIAGETAMCDLRAVNQHGEPVVSGSAQAALG